MKPPRQTVVAVCASAILAVGCQSAQSPTTPAPVASTSPRPSASAAPTATYAPSASAEVLTGTIAFGRFDGAGEHYFTIRPDGSDERDLFSAQGCTCLQLSPDGSAIWSLSETEHGTAAHTTMKVYGTERTVHLPEIKTLSLATGPGASTPDGQTLAFGGWDDTDHANGGIYLAGPDLVGLRRVTALPDGVKAVAPYGVTPDGSKILFFGETGSVGPVTHTGNLYVVDADGENLKRLNPEGVLLAEVRGLPASLSPDGTKAAFAGFEGDPNRNAVYVVSLDGGPAQRITDVAAGIWSAAWAPVGDLIAFATWSNDAARISVVHADGTGRDDLSEPGDEVGSGAWSPEGTHLLVSRGPDGSRDLWIMDLEGTFVAQVTDQPAEYGIYRWGPEF